MQGLDLAAVAFPLRLRDPPLEFANRAMDAPPRNLVPAARVGRSRTRFDRAHLLVSSNSITPRDHVVPPSRKSAPFRVEYSLSPAITVGAFAFSGSPLPATRSSSLAVGLPGGPGIGLTEFRAVDVAMTVGPACGPGGFSTTYENPCTFPYYPLTFWFKPVSTFGLFGVTVLLAVQHPLDLSPLA